MDKIIKMIKRLKKIKKDYYCDAAVVSSYGILGPLDCDDESYIDSNEIKDIIEAHNIIEQYNDLNEDEISLLEKDKRLQIDKARTLLKNYGEDFIRFLIETIDTASVEGFYYVDWYGEYMLAEDWLDEACDNGATEFREWKELDDDELEMWYNEVVRLKI